MIKVEVPKTPAQAWRDLDSQGKAFKVGLVLRIVWEVSKPILAWTAFILIVGAWSVTYAVLKALFSK